MCKRETEVNVRERERERERERGGRHMRFEIFGTSDHFDNYDELRRNEIDWKMKEMEREDDKLFGQNKMKNCIHLF